MAAIGGLSLDTPFILAPMAGFTDAPFRIICEEMGAAMTCTEMVSAKGLCYGSGRSRELLDIRGQKKPVAFQIFGSEPDIMGRAARELDRCGNAVLDVNMGCPVPKVVKNGEGSALLRDPDLIYDIIKAMTGATDKPVTAKLRTGIDGAPPNAAVLAAQAVEAAGGSAVTVHGRSREQYYGGSVDRAAIKAVRAAVSIPVIANGDIRSFADAESMMAETGCEAVMIGRAALGDPWIFRRLKAGREGLEPPAPPAIAEIRDMMIRHYRMEEERKGEYVAIREMRKFTAAYIRGLRGAGALRREVNMTESGAAYIEVLGRHLQGGGA